MFDGDGRRPLRFGTIVVVGGGCYGGYYVRQLHRAARAGALTADALLVVDRDGECAVAHALQDEHSLPIDTRIIVSEWRSYFARYSTEAAASPTTYQDDAIVPSPLMPHLMA